MSDMIGERYTSIDAVPRHRPPWRMSFGGISL
jgi:hypothetical protein